MKLILDETFLYVVITGIIFLALYVAILVFMLVLIPLIGKHVYFDTAGHIFFFLLFLFGNRAVANLVWICLCNNRFYIAKDPLTYFIPIVPFGWWAIDPMCGGHLLGNVRMWQLRLLWLFISIIVWSTTLVTYRIFYKNIEIA